jgi:hypothetical protein
VRGKTGGVKIKLGDLWLKAFCLSDGTQFPRNIQGRYFSFNRRAFFRFARGFYHVESGFDLYYCDAAGFSCDLIKWREALGARPPAPLFPHPLKNRFITFPQVTPFDLQGFGNPAQGGRS